MKMQDMKVWRGRTEKLLAGYQLWELGILDFALYVIKLYAPVVVEIYDCGRYTLYNIVL